MSQRRRALDIEDPSLGVPPLPPSTGTVTIDPRSRPGPAPPKRKSDVSLSEPPPTRQKQERRVPPAADYALPHGQGERTPDLNEILDESSISFPNEDRVAYPDDPQRAKPIRHLTQFAFYLRGNERLITLDNLENDVFENNIIGSGWVVPQGIIDELEEEDGVLESEDPVYANIDVIRSGVDVTDRDGDYWVESKEAWYILYSPSSSYRIFWQFYKAPRHITQIALSLALEQKPINDYQDCKFDTADESAAAPFLYEAYLEHDKRDELRSSEIITKFRRLLGDDLIQELRAAPRRRRLRGPPKPALTTDSSVLKAENLNETRVSPFVSVWAEKYFRESITVVGPKVTQTQKANTEEAARQRLWNLVRKAFVENRDVFLRENIRIGNTTYEFGDHVYVPSGTREALTFFGSLAGRTGDDLYATFAKHADGISYPDLFQIGKIIGIDQGEAHVLWLQHSSKTILGELGNEKECFYTSVCQNIRMDSIIAKVHVIDGRSNDFNETMVRNSEFFFRQLYNEIDASFTPVPSLYTSEITSAAVHQHCPSCAAQIERQSDMYGEKIDNGVRYAGEEYHALDFALYSSSDGPAEIIHIRHVTFPEGSSGVVKITGKKVGRILDIRSVVPNNEKLDERELFLTNEDHTIDIERLVKPIFILLKNQHMNIEDEWLALSPLHYYVRFCFPSTAPVAWGRRINLTVDDLMQCTPCHHEKRNKYIHDTLKFLEEYKMNPLKVLDVFAGVGAFSKSMAEGSGCMKVTYGIEVAPSTAETFRAQNPSAIIYNNCSNMIFENAVRQRDGKSLRPLPPHRGETEKEDKTPQLPKPGEFDILVAGFPWKVQGFLSVLFAYRKSSPPHSNLNMFRRAQDKKTSLILNTLSWIDFLKPPYVYLENVEHFLSYNLMAQQKDKHTVRGGVPSGGLKLVIRVLLDLRYQVRFAVLQAGHYGAPQSRIRFFLIAAREDKTLPEFPQPTHHFPLSHGNKSLKMTVKQERSKPILCRPISIKPGCAPHPFVTVNDAIGDLSRWDMRLPSEQEHPEDRTAREHRQASSNVTPFQVETNPFPRVGPEGVPAYHHGPRTRHQINARKMGRVQNLQHYSRFQKEVKVRMILSIPLRANADYHDAPDELKKQFWHLSDPLSSMGRRNYPKGSYARLDGKSYFNTTVTNVDPTAKQCKVLHPYCKRMISVRELARSQGFPDSFEFKAEGGSIVTMHRQIGNAVAWPVGVAFGRELRRAFLNDRSREGDEIMDS